MQHIVLFNFDAKKFANEFPENSIQEAIDELRMVKIPGLVEINFGAKNSCPWEGYQDASQGYTHALVSRHVNANALHLYADHPAHKALQVRLFKCLAGPPLRMEIETVAHL